jgi:hypothetical protein
MTTHPIYAELLAEVTDELERDVLHILLISNPKNVTRQQFVMKIFNYFPDDLENNQDDRKVRAAIEHLRQDWPIISSSGGAGYRLSEDPTEIQAFAAEQASRAERNRENAQRAYRWIPKANSIHEARRSAQIVKQPSLL